LYRPGYVNTGQGGKHEWKGGCVTADPGKPRPSRHNFIITGFQPFFAQQAGKDSVPVRDSKDYNFSGNTHGRALHREDGRAGNGVGGSQGFILWGEHIYGEKGAGKGKRGAGGRRGAKGTVTRYGFLLVVTHNDR